MPDIYGEKLIHETVNIIINASPVLRHSGNPASLYRSPTTNEAGAFFSETPVTSARPKHHYAITAISEKTPADKLILHIIQNGTNFARERFYYLAAAVRQVSPRPSLTKGKSNKEAS